MKINRKPIAMYIMKIHLLDDEMKKKREKSGAIMINEIKIPLSNGAK